jgi:hypothetical protein
MEYFIHLPEFQVIICKNCQYAVLPSQIDAHFAAKRQHGLDRKEWQRIANEIAEIDGLIGNEDTWQRCFKSLQTLWGRHWIVLSVKKM